MTRPLRITCRCATFGFCVLTFAALSVAAEHFFKWDVDGLFGWWLCLIWLLLFPSMVPFGIGRKTQ